MQFGRRERALLCGLGCLLAAPACAIVPRNAIAVGVSVPVRSVPKPRPHSDEADRALPIVRDPFVAEETRAQDPSPSAPAGRRYDPIPGIPVLPPNRAVAAGNPKTRAATLSVRAILSGTGAAALVSVGQTLRLIKPGDELAGKRVESIEADAVVLAGNLRLPLEP
jgi:hypothetical protein